MGQVVNVWPSVSKLTGNGSSCAKLDFIGWLKSPSSSFLMRAPTTRNAGNTHWNSRGIRLGSLFFESDCFQTQTSTCCEGRVKVRRRIVPVVWVTSWPPPHTGEVDEFREELFHGKEHSVCVGRLFNDEDAVKYASGCWPRGLTNRWYSVTDVERRRTSPPLVASSDCSRCSQTLFVLRRIVFEKKAKATSNQTKPLVTQERTRKKW